jgi:hypothetical protein
MAQKSPPQDWETWKFTPQRVPQSLCDKDSDVLNPRTQPPSPEPQTPSSAFPPVLTKTAMKKLKKQQSQQDQAQQTRLHKLAHSAKEFIPFSQQQQQYPPPPYSQQYPPRGHDLAASSVPGDCNALSSSFSSNNNDQTTSERDCDSRASLCTPTGLELIGSQLCKEVLGETHATVEEHIAAMSECAVEPNPISTPRPKPSRTGVLLDASPQLRANIDAVHAQSDEHDSDATCVPAIEQSNAFLILALFFAQDRDVNDVVALCARHLTSALKILIQNYVVDDENASVMISKLRVKGITNVGVDPLLDLLFCDRKQRINNAAVFQKVVSHVGKCAALLIGLTAFAKTQEYEALLSNVMLKDQLMLMSVFCCDILGILPCGLQLLAGGKEYRMIQLSCILISSFHSSLNATPSNNPIKKT